MAIVDEQPEEKRTQIPLGGREAIVIGASGEIDREIALHLAEKGAKVILHYSSSQHSAEEVTSIINKPSSSSDGVRAISCKSDVVEPSQVAQLFDAAKQKFGLLYIVVNNAGVLDPKYLILFNVNCNGSFLYSREAAKRIVRGGGDRIINIRNSIVRLASPGFGAYASSKAAVEISKLLSHCWKLL